MTRCRRPCVHLQQLFRLCEKHEIKLASSDLIHIVCTQCNEKEVCPSVLTDEHDAQLHDDDSSRLESPQAEK